MTFCRHVSATHLAARTEPMAMLRKCWFCGFKFWGSWNSSCPRCSPL